MARIREFEQLPATKGRRQSDVSCGWRIVEVDGEKLLQLDTYGSSQRKLVGKTSQAIQIDRDGAETLLKLLYTAFPDLS